MSDPTKWIKIDDVLGGRPQDQEALKRNYFDATGVNSTYLFYTPSGEQIPTIPPVLADDRDFSFELPEMSGVIWTVTKFAIDHEAANGTWTNTEQVAQDEGTFQAQAGGTGEDEAAAAGA